jgi:hypothetical protein
MAVLTPAVYMQIALACGNGADPRLIDAIAAVESGRDTAAVNRNANGTIDAGPMQINSSHFGEFGLNAQAVRDPCTAIRTGVAILAQAAGGMDALQPEAVDRLADRLAAGVSAYNTGSPTAGISNGYLRKVMDAFRGRPSTPPRPTRTLASQFPKIGEGR